MQLQAEAKISRVDAINGRSFYVGELRGQKVVMFLSGVSMVNATMMTQTALDHYNITGIVFSGIAGGVNPNLAIGDVTVPAQWAEYQEQVFAREFSDGSYGVPPWFRADLGNYGMMFPVYSDVPHEGNSLDAEDSKFWFDADPEMLAVAQQVSSNVDLENCTASGFCFDHEPEVVVGGKGVSGPTFVDNADYREWVWETFGADALDMETAAVAHVAYTNNVPFIAFRSLSDLAGGGPGENEMGIFFQLAANNSATVVLEFLDAWGHH